MILMGSLRSHPKILASEVTMKYWLIAIMFLYASFPSQAMNKRDRSHSGSNHISIVYTDTIEGNLVPCNCSGITSGGLAKLGQSIRSMSDGGPGHKPVLVDLGGFNSLVNRYNYISAPVVCKYFGMLKYDAVGIGENELALPSKELATELGLLGSKALLSNATLDKKLGSQVQRVRFVQTEGARVALLGFISPDFHSANLKSIEPMKDAIRELNPQLSRADVVIALALSPSISPSDFEGTSVSLLLGSDGGTTTDEAMRHVVPCSPRNTTGGRTLTRLDIGFAKREVYEVKTDRKLMIRELDDLPEIVDLVRQSELSKIEILEKRVSSGSESTLGFSGSRTCEGCHEAEYGQWKLTAHSMAFKTLQSRFVGNSNVPQYKNPECLQCHSTAFDVFGGSNQDFDVKGVACEQCHGPGERHAEFYYARKRASAVGAEIPSEPQGKFIVLDPSQETCIKCHDPLNSPGFKFSDYYVKILHRPKGGSDGSSN
jgi:hypothetical protein